jgi:hypothetical protein
MVGRGALTDGERAICFCLPLVGSLGAPVPGNGIVNLARELQSFLEKEGERRKKVEKWDEWSRATLLFPLQLSHSTREIASA